MQNAKRPIYFPHRKRGARGTQTRLKGTTMSKTEIALEGVIENLLEALAAAQAAKNDLAMADCYVEQIKTKMGVIRFHLKEVK